MNAASIEFGILGPLAVTVDGRPVFLGRRKQRALLTLLLLNRNEARSRSNVHRTRWPSRNVRRLDWP